jgi:hypothetical protein
MFKIRHLATAATLLLGSSLASSGSSAQVQFGVCGPPPLPPCNQSPRLVEREYVDRLGSICRTRYLRCELDEPQPVRSRCTCEDEDGEEVIGRVR